MENVLFKISFPAEFHAQTAVECAMELHPRVKDRLDDIAKITLRTHESAIRIIDKQGPLANPADRDHCIQYMVAVPLIHGRLTAADYEDNVAADPRIDQLRAKMVCVEDKAFSKDYHDPDKRSIANGITIELNDGTKLKEVVVEYPIGHRRRRKEGLPVLVDKFRTNLARRFPAKQQQAILDVALDAAEARSDAGARVRRPDGDLTRRADPLPMPRHLSPRPRARGFAAAANAQEFPKLKPGLWSTTTTTVGRPKQKPQASTALPRRFDPAVRVPDVDGHDGGPLQQARPQGRGQQGDDRCRLRSRRDASADEVGDDDHRRHRVSHRGPRGVRSAAQRHAPRLA